MGKPQKTKADKTSERNALTQSSIPPQPTALPELPSVESLIQGIKSPSATEQINQNSQFSSDKIEDIDTTHRINTRNGIVGGITHQGRRLENQDALGFQTITNKAGAQIRVIVVADGIAGSQDAKLAAMITVDAFLEELEKKIKSNEVRASSMFEDVYHKVTARLVDVARDKQSPKDALATTVMAIVETEHEFVYSYLGNGGIYLFRRDAPIKNRELYYSLLTPQEAGQETASISPSGMSHRPFTGSVAKYEGDIVLVGTDGIFSNKLFSDFFNVYTYRLPAYIYKHIIPLLPYGQQVVEGWLDAFVGTELYELTTNQGIDFIDDNVSLGIIGAF